MPTSFCKIIPINSSNQLGSKIFVSSFKNKRRSPEDCFTARLLIFEKLKLPG